MAAKNDADAAEEQKKFGEILKLLRKKRPLNTAVRIGGPAKIVLEADKRKKPKALRKIAKDNGGGPKFVSGVISLQGKVITIQTIEEDFPGALQKLMKNYLRDMGQAGLRVEIVAGSADENGAAEVDDDDEDAPAATASEAQPEEGPSARRVNPDVADPASASEPPTGAGATQARAAPEAAAQGTAQATETRATSAQPGAVQSGLMDGLRNMKPMIKNVASNGTEQDTAKMKKLSDGFKKAVKSSDEALGQKILTAMTNLSNQIGASGGQQGARPAAERRTKRRASLETIKENISQLMKQIA